MTLLKRIIALKDHFGLRRYAANTFWMFIENILRMIAGILVGIWVARYLGPSNFGIFNYSLSFCSIFSAAAALGLNSIVVRDLVHDPERKDICMGTSFWLKTAASLASILIIAAAVALSGNDAKTCLYIMIIAVGIAFQGFDVIDFYFQSQVLVKFVSICKITQLLLSSALKIYFVVTGAGLIWFVMLCAFDQFTLATTLLLAYYRKNQGISFIRHFDIKVAKRMLTDSSPLILSGIAGTFYSRIDQVLIKSLLGERDVGLFAAAVRLTEIGYFIPIMLCNSLFPALINARKNDMQVYYERMQRLITLLVWMSIAIALPLSIFGNQIITLLYGKAYHDAGVILIITCWTGIFSAMGAASGPWFIAENLQRISFYKTCYGAASSVILNLVLIPIYGFKGAALSMLLTQLIVSWGSDLFMSVTRPIFFMKLRSFYSYKARKVSPKPVV